MSQDTRIFIFSNEGHPVKGGAATVCLEMARAARSLGLRPVLALPDHGRLRELQPLEVLPLPIKPNRHPSNQRRLRRVIEELLRTGKIQAGDAIHLAEAGPVEAWARAAHSPRVRDFSGRLFLTLHGSEVLRAQPWPWKRRAMRSLLERADAVQVLSPYVAELVGRLAPRAKAKPRLLPGAPRELEAGAAEGGASLLPDMAPDRLHVVQVGRIHPRKGQLGFLEALDHLPADVQEKTEAWIVGPVKKPRYFRKCAARAIGLKTRVHFVHGAPDATLAHLYRHAAVGVLPSEPKGPSVEGLGLVLLEAARFGVPAVAHDTGGIRYAVDPGKTGLLSPPGNPQALADNLGRLLRDSGLRARMGDAARAFAARHTWEAAARALYVNDDADARA